MKNIILSVLVTGGMFTFTGCNQKTMIKEKAIKLENMDLTADLTADFDQYANGGWKALNAIPQDRSRYGSFDQLGDNNEKQVRELVEEIANSKNKAGSVADKIGKFYQLGMDTAKIEKDGLSVLDDEFARIQNMNSTSDIQNQLLHFGSHWISTAFLIYGGADSKNSDTVITNIEQSGLGLPDRDYYLKPNPQFTELLAKYKEHVQKMFELIGDNEELAAKNAQTIINFETRLAKATMDRITSRDPHKTYNKMNMQELAALAGNIDWGVYFEKAGIGNPGEVIVSQPDFIKEVNAMISDVTVEDWKTYFRWNLINEMASYLTQDIVNQNFGFYGKAMSGTPEIKPRWKRVLNVTNSVLSEAVGQVYVARYFPPEAKERMLALVANLQLALGERINDLDWMGDETKANAQVKLKAMKVKVGYPDKWKDYSTLEVKDDAYVLNIFRARNFSFNENMGKINKPVDKTEWHMPPQMVNAYYSPVSNEIVFPAGILQPPFFYMHSDDAVNYGAIGVVIGHEMTHGFDDQGRLYDADGNLNTWWTDEDEQRFKERTKVLVNQFNEFEVADSVFANGEYTLGENIADLGGINVSFTAFKKTEQYKNQQELIDSLTPNQRFFLSYAHVWAQNIRPEEVLQLNQIDVHSLGKYRVIGPLRNVPQFHEAFKIPEGSYMRLPDSLQAKIW